MRKFIDSNGRVIDESVFDNNYIKQFEKDFEVITLMGYNELQSGCFIVNYKDDFICETYNGGCKCKLVCEEIKEKLLMYNEFILKEN